MCLIHLNMHDLTRALTVSKYCRGVIMGSKACRRTLWLEPEGAFTSFLEYREGVNEQQYLLYDDEPRRYQPVLFQEAGERRLPVVKVHPLIEVRKNIRTSCTTRHVPWEKLISCVPDTLLTQPPVTKVSIEVVRSTGNPLIRKDGSCKLKCGKGVTFGAIVKQVDKLHKPTKIQRAEIFLRIVAQGVVAEDADCVQVAKKVLTDQLKAGPVNPQDQGVAASYR